jgi:hypothetical protein
MLKGGNMALPEVVVYWDANWGGDNFRTNLDITYVGDDWNDQISSIIVVSGTWQFFENSNYGGVASKLLTPGYYSFVENSDVNIANDSISSFKVVSFDPV